jgi:hypothetical protein
MCAAHFVLLQLVQALMENAIKQMSSFRPNDYGLIAEAIVLLGVTPDARFVTEVYVWNVCAYVFFVCVNLNVTAHSRSHSAAGSHP